MRRGCVSVWGRAPSNHQRAGSLEVLLQSKTEKNGGLQLQPVGAEPFHPETGRWLSVLMGRCFNLAQKESNQSRSQV